MQLEEIISKLKTLLIDFSDDNDTKQIRLDGVSMNEFIDDFFKPWYKATGGTEDEQIEGEDPIIAVEKIITSFTDHKEEKERLTLKKYNVRSK